MRFYSFINKLLIPINIIIKNDYYIQQVSNDLENLIINDELVKNNIENIYFQSRIKKRSRIIQKMLNKKTIPCDIYGIRIIYDNTKQLNFAEKSELIDTINICNYNFYKDLDTITLYREFYAYYIHYLIIKNYNIYNNNNIDDYINNPKQNNYRSIHTYIIKDNFIYEIQIRSIDMHYHAVFGNASKYYL